MTLYLARHASITLTLGTGKSLPMEDNLGNRRLVETIPGLEAKFDPNLITSRCMEVANQIWFTGPPGFEDKAMLPSPTAGIHREITVNEDGTGTLGREVYFHGSRKENYLSAFDSADPRHYIPIVVEGKKLTPADFVVFLDDILQSHPNFGEDFVRVDAVRLPAPWPTYDEISGAAGAKLIEDTIVNVTRNPDAVIAYEHQRDDHGRPMFVAAAERARDRINAIRSEEAALEVSP